MFRLITCVTATCDGCSAHYEDDDFDGIPHWDDQAEAERWLTNAGWRVHTGGRLTCHRCAALQDCATYGHRYDPWSPCLCGGRVPTHTTVPTEVCTREFPDRVGRCPCAGSTPGHTSVQIEMCTHQIRWCQHCLRTDRRPQTPQPKGNL